MPGSWSRRSSRPAPTVVLVLAAPLLGLAFVVVLPLLGLAAIGWGLSRKPAETPARPAEDPGPGHPEPRPPHPEVGAGR
jgi:hypothetical protein